MIAKIVAIAAFVSSAAAAGISLNHKGPSCPIAATSCNNYTIPVDGCCTETKGGLMMITELWNTGTPDNGPQDKWTIHGVWSDYCWNGLWPQFCDPSRMLNNTVTQVLTEAGEHELLHEMNTYWLGTNGTASNAPFWEHEWNKHGTCMSTLEPHCLPKAGGKASKHQDAITFYKTVIRRYRQFDMYKALAASGIVPRSKPYLTQDVSNAIQKYFGTIPNVQCYGETISAIWLYFTVEGTVPYGKFIPTNPDSGSNCNTTLIYPVKVKGPGF